MCGDDLSPAQVHGLFRNGGDIMKLRIMVYEAYTIALQAMCDVLKDVQNFEIIGAYTSEEELLAGLNAKAADILVADVMLKSSHGLELIGKVREVRKNVRIIILTENRDEVVYKRALEMGVSAFLNKDTSDKELINSIINTAKGNAIVPEFIVRNTEKEILSKVEIKVLQLIADEKTTEEIAKQLFISRRTVETHVTNICRKLDVSSRVGAVGKAIKLNII
jgi:two-component system vancomycin resistance associated response regulator VraR